MANGYMGKILFVDLAEKSCRDETLSEEMCRDFMGGYGIAARILYERMKPGVDPLGPDNMLGFMTGPLTGTPTMCSGRFVVVAKSPLTRTWGDANCGGTFSPAIKRCGYDAIFIKGVSEKPVYLYVDDNGAELRDAAHVWGKDAVETEDQMQNFVEPFAVTDTTVVSRRQVVDDAKCENCHSNLSLHGDNRNDGTGYCQTCHQPWATDEAVRPEGEGAPQSIDFRYMIHKIHATVELETCYTVYGYRSSFHDEWCAMEEFVGDLRNCETCHVDDSYTLPLNDGLEAVTTPRDYWTPMLPETASCLSCHDSSSTAVHAQSNTTALGEACSTCHGVGKTYSVERVHAH